MKWLLPLLLLSQLPCEDEAWARWHACKAQCGVSRVSGRAHVRCLQDCAKERDAALTACAR